MNIYEELDRIRGQGFRVIITWGVELAIVPDAYASDRYAFRTIRASEEKWEHCLYRAIMHFDDKHAV